MLRRLPIAAGLGALACFALFYLMQALISLPGAGLEEEAPGRLIEFVRLKREPELELRKRRPPEKPPPEEPPPPPEIELERSRPPNARVAEVMPVLDSSLRLAGGPNLGAPPADTDIIPLVRIEPEYPSRALSRDIEGWVEVEFTITAAGTVQDPVVVQAEPSSIFNRAALRAIRKWKYNPKVVDGVPVERPGVRVRLTFNIRE
jgi:protein TonB